MESYIATVAKATTNRPEWTRTNNIGIAGEQVVAAVFRKIGIVVAKLQDRSADLELIGRIEVKSDQKAHRTSRVAVEIAYRNRPSGLSTTTANTWAFVLQTGEVLLIGTNRLRAAIASLPDRPAGEGATIRLLPLATLRSLALNVGGEPK